MAIDIPRVTVGSPKNHESIAAFPLYARVNSDVVYLLADDGMELQTVNVEEVNRQGYVSELMVHNTNKVRVLFVEGQELVGAKQNRIVNTSVLVPANSRIQVPVSCVEEGRWEQRSRRFSSAGRHASSRLRSALKRSVSSSLRRNRGHRSDQAQVWAEVNSLQGSLSVCSTTHAMSDTYQSYRRELIDYQLELEYEEGANGLALAIDSRLVSIDLFDKPHTCQRIWPGLIAASVLDSLNAEGPAVQVEVAELERHLDNLVISRWDPVVAVGEGEEFRCQTENGSHASLLSLDGTLIHASWLTNT